VRSTGRINGCRSTETASIEIRDVILLLRRSRVVLGREEVVISNWSSQNNDRAAYNRCVAALGALGCRRSGSIRAILHGEPLGVLEGLSIILRHRATRMPILPPPCCREVRNPRELSLHKRITSSARKPRRSHQWPRDLLRGVARALRHAKKSKGQATAATNDDARADKELVQDAERRDACLCRGQQTDEDL